MIPRLYKRQPEAHESVPMAWYPMKEGLWVSCPDCGSAKAIDKFSAEVKFHCAHCQETKVVMLMPPERKAQTWGEFV